MKTNPNEPIATICSDALGQTIYDGLSKREYFAGLAMQGCISQYTARVSKESLAEWCVGMADAIINELNK